MGNLFIWEHQPKAPSLIQSCNKKHHWMLLGAEMRSQQIDLESPREVCLAERWQAATGRGEGETCAGVPSRLPSVIA